MARSSLILTALLSALLMLGAFGVNKPDFYEDFESDLGKFLDRYRTDGMEIYHTAFEPPSSPIENAGARFNKKDDMQTDLSLLRSTRTVNHGGIDNELDQFMEQRLENELQKWLDTDSQRFLQRVNRIINLQENSYSDSFSFSFDFSIDFSFSFKDTFLPSVQPTAQPSPLPSQLPSVTPTAIPTEAPIPFPSAIPSFVPLPAPTSNPTFALSEEPTSSPSSYPTAEPTEKPSYCPTVAATALPSAKPSYTPSTAPTMDPTSTPTAFPTTDPTSFPSGKPTFFPTPAPTERPTPAPSSSPTASPTLIPTSNPSPEPTGAPSPAPSFIPTSAPTFMPTGTPTSAPTSETPTLIPTLAPISQPTLLPTSIPTLMLMPTDVPTGTFDPTLIPVPSEIPTGISSPTTITMPSAIPTITSTPTLIPMPSAAPIGLSTPTVVPVPSATPTGIPTPTLILPAQPTLQPSFLPTSKPTLEQSLPLTLAPTFMPTPLETRPVSTLAPILFPTPNPDLSPTSTETSVTISSQIAVNDLDCDSFNADIEQQDALSQVVFDGLSTYISVLSITNMTAFGCEQDNSTFVETRRLNSILANVGFATVVASQEPENALSIVQAALLRLTGDGSFDEAVADVRDLANGEQNEAEFNEEETIILVQSRTIFGLDNFGGEEICILPITTPILSSAKFDNAGIVLEVILNVATDLGGRSIGDEFDCDSIFIIPAVTDAICQWTTALQVSIDVTSASSIDLAETNTVTLIDGVLKNECNRDDAELCKCFPTNEASTITLESPDVPVAIEIQAPQSTSMCIDLRISGDQSSGGAGQGFTVDWTVSALPIEHDTTREVLQALQNPVLSANENGDLSVVYSSGQLTTLYEDGGISTLLLTLELTNVFGRSDSGTVSIDVFPEERPFIEIVGPQLFPHTFSRDEDVIVTTYGGVVTCDEARESASVTYEYDLLQYIDDALVPTGLESGSVDQTEFFLNAYTLDAGAIYALTVLVTDTENGESNQATADIQIEISALVANIRGGDRDISQRGTEELSAERSFDPDLAPDSTGDVITGAAAGLAFEWSCENVDLPSDTASCEEALESSSTTEETLLVTRAALIFQTYRFTVIVSKGTRRASSSVQLTRTLDPPDVFIDGVSTTEVVNDVTEETRIVGLSTDRLILEYTTFAYRDQAAGALTLTSTWSVADSVSLNAANLEDVSRTALTVSRIDDGLETGCEDDDLTWFKIGEPEKNCDWVAEWFHFRCDGIGDDGRFAYEACTYSCTNGCLFIRNQGFLVLTSDALLEGITYTFRLDASLTGARSSGSATIDILVPRGPRGGTLLLSPEKGTTIEDLFDIEAPGWTSENLPLEYQFGAVGGQILRAYSADPSATDVILPPGRNCDLEIAEDSTSWYKTGEPNKDCAWVEGKPTTRCDARGGDDRMFAQDACFRACACYLTVSVSIRDSLGATTKSSTAALVKSSELEDAKLIEATRTLISSALTNASYDDVCNIIVASARTAPENSLLLDELVSGFSQARSFSRTSEETIELYAACIDEIVTNATALTIEAAQTSLGEITALSQDADSLNFESEAAINVVDALSNLLESALFFPSAIDNEELRRLQVATVTDASENVSAAIDALSIAIASVTFPDEEQTSVDAPNVAIRTRRSAGLDSNTLTTSNTGGITLPSQQDVTYTTTLAELRINTHRLEGDGDGDGLTSDAVMRLGLTALDEIALSNLRIDPTKETNTTAQLSIPRSPNATQAPTAAPLFENVTIVCPWNFDGFASAFCAAENRTITRKCNKTKVEIVEGCGETKREACVTWDASGRSWNRDGCFLNSALSTSDSVVCDCDVIIGPAQNATARHRPSDRASRDVFDTYAQIFESQVFGGDVNARRAKIIIGALCAFAVLIILLMIVGEILDREDDLAHAVGGPSAAETYIEEEEEEEESNLRLDIKFEDSDELSGQVTPAKGPISSNRPVSIGGRVSIDKRKSIAERHLDLNAAKEPWSSRWFVAMKYKHPFLAPWALYSERNPRSLRFLALGIEMLVVVAFLALEQTIEYPDPNCSGRKSQRTCRRRKTWSGRQMCQWSERTGDCRHNGPPSDYFKTLEHMLTVIITTMLLIPMLVILNMAFRIIVRGNYVKRGLRQSGGAPVSAEGSLSVSNSGSIGNRSPGKNSEVRRPSIASLWSRSGSSEGHSTRPRTIGGRNVLFELPAERQARKYKLRQRLRAAFLSKYLVKEAELRTDDVIVLVRARHDEIREDMSLAAAEGSIISARRNLILHNFYRDFVKEWGYSNDDATLRHNVKTHILRDLELARTFYDNLESIHNVSLQRDKLLECAKICRLNVEERRIYNRCIVDLDRVQSGNDFDQTSVGTGATVVPSRLKTAIAIITIVGIFAASTAWLILFGSNVGQKETYAWMVESSFVIFILYFLVAPFSIYLVYVAMPALIDEKLEHIPKLNSLNYPWTTQLPEDALDYLFILKPRYITLLPDPDDEVAARLRQTPKSQISLDVLEEIELDRRWHNIATISVGLVFAGLLLSTPIVVQETILDEVMLLAPLAAFALITQSFNVDLEGKPWGTVVICIFTIVLSTLILVGITSLVVLIHRRILLARDASIKKHRENTHNFERHETGIDTSAILPSPEAPPELALAPSKVTFIDTTEEVDDKSVAYAEKSLFNEE